MSKLIPTVAVASLLAATAALAQTTAPSEPSNPNPSLTPDAAEPMTPPAAAPSPALEPSGAIDAAGPKLSDAEAKAWINKTIYSSDDKNVGEVAAFVRDSSGNVTELHADIGGFLGLGETRVRLAPSEFKLMNDRVVLNVTADQAKTLPKVESN